MTPIGPRGLSMCVATYVPHSGQMRKSGGLVAEAIAREALVAVSSQAAFRIAGGFHAAR